MKSNKNFHKAKKTRPFSDENELKGKKVIPLAKKDKYFKQEIFNEIDEFEDIEEYDLEENQDDFDEIEDDSFYEEDEDE
jgi:hypothetical protein